MLLMLIFLPFDSSHMSCTWSATYNFPFFMGSLFCPSCGPNVFHYSFPSSFTPLLLFLPCQHGLVRHGTTPLTLSFGECGYVLGWACCLGTVQLNF